MNLNGKKIFKIILFYILIIAYMQSYTKICFCAPKKDLLLDKYYFQKFHMIGMRVLVGGVNNASSNSRLDDVRGGGLEFEYEKMDASAFFSGIVGLGYISLDDSSSAIDKYLKHPFLKAGFNIVPFSVPQFLNLKIGPDIRLIHATFTDKGGQESHMGLGFGINLMVDFSIKKEWFIGGGVREGKLYFHNEDLDTRYFFFQIQRNF